ncbi:hypothetical protein [Streptomyces hypolithicus]
MTQSGQGDESRLPAARPPAHEGVVLPADGSGPWIPGTPEEHVAPAGGQPWGDPWGPQSAAAQQQQAQHPQQQHPQQQYGAGLPHSQQETQHYGTLPPVQQQQQQQQPQYAAAQQPQPGALPPQQAHPQQQYGASLPQPQQTPPPMPLPAQTPAGAPAADADATQYIPYVPPAGPGALPPENPSDSTQFLGRHVGPAGPAHMAAADADATQYLPPVPPAQNVPQAPPGAPYGIRPGAPEDRQPPSEFDSLFRTDAGPQPADSTQQMPQSAAHQQPPHQQPQFGAAPQGRAARRNAAAPAATPVAPAAPGGPAARRRSSPLVLIAAVVVGATVLGLGAGALLSGGDEEKPKGNTPVAAASSKSAEAEASQQAAPDPAKPQAKSLDALLADSNDSRASVISAVQSIGSCKNLPKAASDLRAAAKQRTALVTRLEGLTVDKLPDHTKLSASLTAAWKASAAADNHYAAWADQVAGKKGCRKGSARSTPQQQAGNRESGEASQAKKEAVGIWNQIAKRYGLTERTATQL